MPYTAKTWVDGSGGGTPILAADLNNLEQRGPILVYSAGAYPARPTGAVSALYIGPVQPSDWVANDRWMDNS